MSARDDPEFIAKKLAEAKGLIYLKGTVGMSARDEHLAETLAAIVALVELQDMVSVATAKAEAVNGLIYTVTSMGPMDQIKAGSVGAPFHVGQALDKLREALGELSKAEHSLNLFKETL